MADAPAFVLILMLGTFPDGRVTLHPFSDRTGCAEAARAFIETVEGVFYAGCYDFRLGIITDRRDRR